MTGTIVGAFFLGVVANGLKLFGVSPFWRRSRPASSSSPPSRSTDIRSEAASALYDSRTKGAPFCKQSRWASMLGPLSS